MEQEEYPPLSEQALVEKEQWKHGNAGFRKNSVH